MPTEKGGRGGPRFEEQGDIYFLYRPRVEEHEPHALGDIQQFYIVLAPHGASRLRLMNIGRKRLPEVNRHERNWGFVQAVGHSGRKLEEDLRERAYDTKTRGERHLPAVRPAGEGVYGLVRPGRSLHLIYALELPEKPGKVQKALNIAPEASFVLSIKNPEKSSPPGAGLPERDEADYPKTVQELFRDRRFAGEPKLLDYEGAEFVLIGARLDPEEEYGVALHPQHETAKSADIFEELRMARSRHPAALLLEGRWA